MTVGAILAGGTSRRMGTDKALVQLMGRPLLHWAAEALRPLGLVIVVTNTPRAHVLPAGIEARYVADILPGAGPLGGIHAALRSLKPGEDAAVIATCDMPFVPRGLVRALARRIVGAPVSDTLAKLPKHGVPGGASDARPGEDSRPVEAMAVLWKDARGRRQHFPSAIHKRALPVIERRLASDDRSVRSLLDALSTRAIDLGTVAPPKGYSAGHAAFNVNTPEDLREAERIALSLDSYGEIGR